LEPHRGDDRVDCFRGGRHLRGGRALKLFYHGKDGGAESTVWGWWLIEAKNLLSVALLKFADGSREAYHDHAFNSISWVLRGKLVEHNLDGTVNTYTPRLRPIITKRDTFHKVVSEGTTWVFTLRGPWWTTWHEYLPPTGQRLTLTNGRDIVDVR
jgi:hypothetical protein